MKDNGGGKRETAFGDSSQGDTFKARRVGRMLAAMRSKTQGYRPQSDISLWFEE